MSRWFLSAEGRGTHGDFGRVEVCVVHSAAGKVSPARSEPLFNGLKRYVEVNDCVHAVGVLQRLGLGHRTRETWRTDGTDKEG